MAFPTTLQDLDATRGTSIQPTNSPSLVDHITLQDTTIEALEAKVGIDGSAVTTSHDYKLSGVTGTDKAVSLTGTEALTNKTLTSPKINLGSDASQDLYKRKADGTLERIPIGAANTLLGVDGAGTSVGYQSVAGVTTDQANALVGNNTDVAVGTGNKFVTQTGLQHGAEKYAADAGANDTYVITLDPVPTSLTNGMVVHFKANTINTGACTLNVNSLGAKTIKKSYNVDLADGDIAANQLVSVIYDGTNFQMISPVADRRVAVANAYIFRALAINEQSIQGTTYTKKKEVQVNFSGTIHTTFDLRTSSVSYEVFGRLYVNGSAVGAERHMNSTTDATYTETLTIAKGDLVQIYIKTDNASTSTGYVNDFKIGFHLEEASDVSIITN